MDLYLFLKWLHIIAIICWMAGILYLYRLLINHRVAGNGQKDVDILLQGMERRLYLYITLPAMKVAVIGGLGMVAVNHQIAQSTWFILKFICVILLIISTVYAGILVKKARTDVAQIPTSKTLRYLNEIPTLLMLIIVALVVFKPF